MSNPLSDDLGYTPSTRQRKPRKPAKPEPTPGAVSSGVLPGDALKKILDGLHVKPPTPTSPWVTVTKPKSDYERLKDACDVANRALQELAHALVEIEHVTGSDSNRAWDGIGRVQHYVNKNEPKKPKIKVPPPSLMKDPLKGDKGW